MYHEYKTMNTGKRNNDSPQALEMRPQNVIQPQVPNKQVIANNAQAAALAQKKVQQAQAIAQQQVQKAQARAQAEAIAQQQVQKAQAQAQARAQAQAIAQQQVQKAQAQAQARAQAQAIAQQQVQAQNAQAQARAERQAQAIAQQQAQNAQQAQIIPQGRLVPYNSRRQVVPMNSMGQVVPYNSQPQGRLVPYNTRGQVVPYNSQPQGRLVPVNSQQPSLAQQVGNMPYRVQEPQDQVQTQNGRQIERAQQVINQNALPQGNGQNAFPQVNRQTARAQQVINQNALPQGNRQNALPQGNGRNALPQGNRQIAFPQGNGRNALPQGNGQNAFPQGNGQAAIIIQDRKNNGRSQSRIAPCDSQDISKYVRYLKLFCKYNGDDVYDSLAKLAPTLWIWVILSCYDKVVYQPKLITSSCNASYTFLKCESSGNSVTETLHAKVQMDLKNSDSIIMDDINGYIMNMIVAESPNLKPYFMEYVDSGVSFITKDDSKFDLKSIMMASEGPVTDDVLLSKMTKAVEKSVIMKVTFSKAVDAPKNLADVILNQEKPLPTIMKEVSKLLAAIQILGTKYGFAHNDAHPYNILFDGKTGNLVLIDYGRSIFDVSLFDAKSQKDISDRILFEELKSMDVDVMNQVCDDTMNLSGKKSYADFIKRELAGSPCRTLDLMTPASQEISRVLYMFDIMKISYCILIVLGEDPANEQLVSPLMKMKQDDDLGKGMLVKVPTIETLNSMVDNLPEEMLPLVPGLFWFCLMIKYIVELFNDERLTNKLVQVSRSQSYMFVNMDNMHKAGLLSTSGTILELFVPSKLQEFIMQNMNDIEKYASLLKKNVRNQAGAGKAGNAGKATKTMQRSLITEVEKGSSKLFKAENNAYGYRLSKMLKGGAMTNSTLRQILGEDVNDPLQCPIRSNTQKVDVSSFPDVDFTF